MHGLRVACGTVHVQSWAVKLFELEGHRGTGKKDTESQTATMGCGKDDRQRLMRQQWATQGYGSASLVLLADSKRSCL